MLQPSARQAPFHYLLALAAAASLTGCGGGGGGPSTHIDPPSLAPCSSTSIATAGPASSSLKDDGSLSFNDTLALCSVNEYTLTLDAGGQYEFAVQGIHSGSGTLGDPVLTLLDANHHVIQSVDNLSIFTTQFITQFDPHLAYSAPLSGTYYLRVGVSEDNMSGTYQLTAKRPSKDSLLQTVLFLPSDPNFRWNLGSPLGTPAALKYVFVTDPAAVAGDGFPGVTPLTADQRQAVRDILASYSAVANLQFTETTDAANAQLRFAMANLPPLTVGRGISQITGDDANGLPPFDIFLDLKLFSGASPGTQSYVDWIHEIGHTLGLKHPGNYSSNTGTNVAPFIPLGFDSTQYSVMSYNTPSDYPFGQTASSTPAPVDIAAIQYLYGANLSLQGQTKTFTFSDTQPVIETLVTSGANGVIDLGNQTMSATVSLTAGTFSSIGVKTDGSPAHNNIAIPFDAHFIAVIGGKGNDTLYGNELDNTLTGGPGDDVIDGGGGTNTAVYAGKQANFTVTRTAAGYTVKDNTGAEGTDQLINIQMIKFADTPVAIAIDSTVSN